MRVAAAFTNETSRVTPHCGPRRLVVKMNYETRAPAETLLKTEKVTLVLEGTAGGKIRCSASSWEDAKIILEGQALGVPAEGEQLRFRCTARAGDPVEERPLD
jgi:hypothetical protein